MDNSNDINHLWRRHLQVNPHAGDNLSTASVQAVPSGAVSFDGGDMRMDDTGKVAQESSSIGRVWDEKMDSVVDALQELVL